MSDGSEWDGVDRRQPPQPPQYPPNLSVKSWSDLQALISLAVLLLGGIAWGLKLEGRIDTEIERADAVRKSTENDIRQLESSLGNGVLQVLKVRLDSLEIEHERLRQDLETCVGRKSRER